MWLIVIIIFFSHFPADCCLHQRVEYLLPSYDGLGCLLFLLIFEIDYRSTKDILITCDLVAETHLDFSSGKNFWALIWKG